MSSHYLTFLRIMTYCACCFVVAPAFGQKGKPSDASFYADSIKVNTLIVEGKKLATAFDKKAPDNLLVAISICEGKSHPYFKQQQILGFMAIGPYYLYKGRHDSAAYFYTRLMQTGGGMAIARANLGFGNIADYKSDYETAISKNMLALKYFESIKDTSGMAAASGNIGNSYIRLRQYQKAVGLLTYAVDMFTKKGMKRQAANNMGGLARAYKGLGNTQKELELKLKAFNIFKAEGYKKGMATLGTNLGVFYSNNGQQAEAEKYYKIALSNSWQIGDNGNIGLLYNNLSDFYLKQAKYDAAMLCVDSAWYYSQKSGDRLAQADAMLGKAILLHLQRKHVEAEKYSERYIGIKDSIYTDKMQGKVAEMDVQYQTEKRENRIAFLNVENTNKSLLLKNSMLQNNKNQLQITQQTQALIINRLQLKNKDQILVNERLDAEKKEQNIKSLQKQSRIQKLELNNKALQVKDRNLAISIILIVIIAGALLSYLFYNRYKLKQKALLQAEMLHQQDLLTKAVLDAEEKERQRIAGDLHDGVGQLFSAVKMNLTGIFDRVALSRDEDRFLVEKTLALVDESCKEVRAISHQMMPNMLLRSGIASDIKSFIEKIDAESLKVTLDAKGFTDKLESNVEVVLYRVIQETVNNVIKHAKADKLDIKLTRDATGINAVIADNGVGFNTALKDDFGGIGLKNIATRIEYLKGTIDYFSARNKGTTIKVWVPVM
ncbi:sensor histidine kinase [Mucilaginibacter sp.]|uniref:tetratricopeptide repeat-containing sensor histidine kinase n=1 Tax=Mucilaginibacter sp. TaxID=1882438 RepID=UPI0032639A64